ncbi:hypothetical protein PCYB_134310 [Plasmodium cynomolgi strain B]|uniref:Uncharacterized protein n=1 Tax=Plasmodium cynomolgi (strain B) TaxID=1120755 RepID=K6VGV3_PLACD|nr:hypothetical protein PCYB_134310 [Plasmodium cynomolgi strain B]GAB68557.1 hypothetical protein PCYB_134310 [Plasmodium cynomolgi strain B]
MNPKPFYKAPKVTKEDLEREFDKTMCHLKSSWDELTDESQYNTEEELLHRRRKQDTYKSRFFPNCSKNKEQTGIIFKGTSKKVDTYIHDNPPHTCDDSSDSVGRELPFAHHNRRNYNTRGTKLETPKLTRKRGRNLNEKTTMSSTFHGKSKKDDRHSVRQTACAKVVGEMKRNENNGKSFWINKNEMIIPRRCMDQVMSPYSSSKAKQQRDILLTTQMSKFARGKLRLRIRGKNKLNKISQVPVEEKLNDGFTPPLDDLFKGIMPRGGREKKINYREYTLKKSYKNRVNYERHADQHNEKQKESNKVAVGYDTMSKQKRQKGNPHVRICVDKESTRNSDPKCTIDFVQNCASVDKRMQNYLNEQLKYYGSKLRRENLEQVCLFLRKGPQRRVPHGLTRSHRIDEEEHPNVPVRPCQNCKKEINLKSYIIEGNDQKNTATMMTNARDVTPAISDKIMKQMRGREKEKNEGQTKNLAHKNKLIDELKNFKKLQKEEMNFFTIYTHLMNEKKILKKILNQQIRNNKKDYLKKLIQVKKYITNFVTHFEQIMAKIQAEKNGPYAPTHDQDRHHHISCLLKLVEDVISILADHFYHVE